MATSLGWPATRLQLQQHLFNRQYRSIDLLKKCCKNGQHAQEMCGHLHGSATATTDNCAQPPDQKDQKGSIFLKMKMQQLLLMGKPMDER